MRERIEVDYRLEEQIDAMRTFFALRQKGIKALKFVTLMAGVLFSIQIVLALLGGPLNLHDTGVYAVSSVLFALPGALFLRVASRFIAGRLARKSFIELGLSGRSTIYHFGEDTISVEDPVMSSTFAWTELRKVHRNGRMLLLFRSENLFYHLPVSQVDPGALETIAAKAISAGAKPA